jgi:UDP-2,3-diacylglucosamine pyrophosphatase LpxH
VRTLIVSDLHLGQRAHQDVLRLAAPRARLLEALDRVDRLVLLGDVVELTTRQTRRPMAVAEPILRQIGERLGPGRELVLVPGNHDGALVRSWALAQGRELGTADAVASEITRALSRVTSWLAPARVRVSYPGVWLGDGVWATHGHYLDRHLLPESSFGVPRGRLRDGHGLALPADYERPRHGGRGRRRGLGRRGHAGLGFGARLRSRPVATVIETLAELTRVATMQRVPEAMMRVNLAPVTARLIDTQMRHASVPAMAHVARRLGIDAEWIVFGHVHRGGPREGERWQLSLGGPRLVNTGSWLYEPLLLDRAAAPHPYWPGGAVLLESGHDPRALCLLDGLTGAELRPSR